MRDNLQGKGGSEGPLLLTGRLLDEHVYSRVMKEKKKVRALKDIQMCHLMLATYLQKLDRSNAL